MLTGQVTTLSTSYNVNPANFMPTFCTFLATNPPKAPSHPRGSLLLIPYIFSASKNTKFRHAKPPAIFASGLYKRSKFLQNYFSVPSKINTIVPSTAKIIKFANGVNIKSISPTHPIKNVAGIKTNRLNTCVKDITVVCSSGTT